MGESIPIGSESSVAYTQRPITQRPIVRAMRRIGFLLLNGWIVFHLTAVFLPGAAMAPSSELARNAYLSTSGYVQVLFMDHGYHFFGPDPGASTLLGFVAETANGEQHRGLYPHKGIYPRLLYHRHFMLTEAIPQIATTDPNLFQLLAQTYGARIQNEFQAKKVELSRVTHRLINADRFVAGGELTDADTYEEQPIGAFQWSVPSAMLGPQ